LAVAGFLLIRAIGLLTLALSPERAGRPLIGVLGVWDGGWYVRIADEGYADHLDLSDPAADQSTGSLAFFPLFPMLIRVVSALTGLESRSAGVVVSLVAGSIAAAGIAILARDWAGDRAGVLAALLWACAPMAVVGTLVYTEALFTALVVWTFIALHRESWLLAGTLGAAAGLTRPTGVALAAAVAAYAGWTWWRGTRGSRADRARPLIAGAMVLAATPLFWVWVGVRAERWDGWFAVQEAFWGSRLDGGGSVFTMAGNLVGGAIAPGIEMLTLATLACLLVAIGLLALAVRDRVWWPLLVYTAISLAMVIGSAGYFSSKLRFLVPMFVLAFPVARWLAGRSRAVQAIAVLAAVVATTLSGTWLLLIWPYAI